MRNIIEQIIELYPNCNLLITLDSGDLVIGRTKQLILGPNRNSGVFELANLQNNLRELLPLCSIDTIRIENATYNNAITYLPVPIPVPTGCCSDCESTIRSLLPIGTPNVSIITNTQTPSQGTVIRNEYGMIVLADANNNPIFISSCKIDVVYI